MSDNQYYTPRRPRMDPDAYRRILTEVARLGPPDPSEIPQTTGKLRDILLDPLEDVQPVEQAPVAAPAAVAPSADAAPRGMTEPVAAPAVRRPGKWDDLGSVDVQGKILDRNLIITANRTDPAYASFDVLRTRLVQALKEKGWKRVAITSPTAGCGKSFTATNLAMTLSRYENCRTILMDMDLRRPALAKYMGLSNVGSMGDMLRGETPITQHLKHINAPGVNIGKNLAIGLNNLPEAYAAELFQQPKTREVLDRIDDELNPDVILYDLPPALAQDDVIAFRPYFDCVLLVVGGGISSAKEIKDVNRRMGEDKPVLGVVLNMAEDSEGTIYNY